MYAGVADVSGDAYSFEDEEENSILKISKKDALDQEVYISLYKFQHAFSGEGEIVQISWPIRR